MMVMFTAIWLMPVTRHYGTGARSGEIDIMEATGEAFCFIYPTHYKIPHMGDTTLKIVIRYSLLPLQNMFTV